MAPPRSPRLSAPLLGDHDDSAPSSSGSPHPHSLNSGTMHRPARPSAIRRSIDAALRHASFLATHNPFDPGEAATDFRPDWGGGSYDSTAAAAAAARAGRAAGAWAAAAGEGAAVNSPTAAAAAAGEEGGGGGEGEGDALLSTSPLAAQPGSKRADAALRPATWAEAGTEARRLLSLAVPLVLQSLASMLLTLVSTVFVGRLGDPVALSGVVLGASVYNVTGVSMVIGLSSALDTLCGQVCVCGGVWWFWGFHILFGFGFGSSIRVESNQVPTTSPQQPTPSIQPTPPPTHIKAYGARSYRLLGVYLQRAQLICWTLCLPVAALWLNVGGCFLGLGWLLAGLGVGWGGHRWF
jgi:hypothetical protein